jgi:hypothetical protein
MSSRLQLEANRRNALKSTGPKTEAGKSASAMNAFKTGLHAKSLVLPSEKAADLQLLIDEYYSAHIPRSPEARAYLDDVILCEWTLRRLNAAENQSWQYIVYDKYSDTKPKYPLGEALNRGGNSFSRLQYRLNSTRRARERALAAFHQLQSAAASAPAVAAIPTTETTSPQIGFVPSPSSEPSQTAQNPAPEPAEAPKPPHLKRI